MRSSVISTCTKLLALPRFWNLARCAIRHWPLDYSSARKNMGSVFPGLSARLEASAMLGCAKPPAPLPQVHGRLRLRFEAAGEAKRTMLTTSEQQAPLGIVRAFPQADGGSLVHLHNLSGGVLGRDRLEMQIDAGPRAIVQLTSIGATRIYRSSQNAPGARQTIR